MSNDYCSILTKNAEVDPIGTAAENITRFLFFELAKPWDSFEKNVPGYPVVQKNEDLGNIKVHLLSPHPVYSKNDYRRILFFELDQNKDGFYHKVDYLIPNDKAYDLVNDLAAKSDLSNYNEYKQDSSQYTRELFICGHYNKDYCCGTFGDELYQFFQGYLANNSDLSKKIRCWQTTHIKGHKFAPTMIDFPEGRFWAHLDQKILINSIINLDRQNLSPELKHHIRGLASTSRFGQMAERELFMEFGNPWKEYYKRIHVELNKDNKYRAEVKIEFKKNSEKVENRLFDVSYTEDVITIDSKFCGELNNFKKVKIEEL